MLFLGEITTMVSMTLFKNKKAFSILELIIAILLASIVMLSVYFMLIMAYGQFNDLTEESERFNNLQVFERIFQRSAMTCSDYKIDISDSNNKKFCFYELKNKKIEIYNFQKSNFVDISTYSITDKVSIYSGAIPEDNSKSYSLIYTSKELAVAAMPSYNEGYTERTILPSYNNINDNAKVLFENIVKVYYETSNKIKSYDDFKKLTGKNLKDLNIYHERWEPSDAYYKIYTPFIKLVIIYRDKKNHLKRAYITCRLRNIEGTENIKLK